MVIRVIYYKLSYKVQITLEGCKRKRDQGNAYLGVMDTSLDHAQQLFQAHEFYFWCLKPGVMQRIFHTAHIVLWACHLTLTDQVIPGNKWYFWTKMLWPLQQVFAGLVIWWISSWFFMAPSNRESRIRFVLHLDNSFYTSFIKTAVS